MTALGGGGGAFAGMDVRAFAAALEAATRRLERMAESSDDVTKAKRQEASSSKKAGSLLVQAGKLAVASGAAKVAAAGAGMYALTGDMQAGMGSARLMAARMAARSLPGIGAVIGRDVELHDRTRAGMMRDLTPWAAAGVPMSDEMLEAVRKRHVGIAQREMEAELAIGRDLVSPQAVRERGQHSGWGAWKWSGGQVGGGQMQQAAGQVIGGLLDSAGISSF